MTAILTQTVLILCVFVLSVLSIYWGVLFRVKDNLHHATIAIVDFDGQLAPYIDDNVQPIIGPYVVNAALAELLEPQHLGWVAHSPAQYNNDPLNVRAAVHDEKIWGAVIINANATSLLQAAVLNGNTSYDPLGCCQIIYNQARDIESYNQYITPPLVALAHSITLNFGQKWTHQVLTNSTYSVDTYTRASQALSPAIGFSIYNLRPFDPPCAIPSVSIGLIYLIIIAFFSFGFFIPTHLQFILPNPDSPHPPLHFHQLVIWRYLATLFAYFLLSLSYSLVSLAFQIPFNHSAPQGMAHWDTEHAVDNANYLKHGGTFALYFILNWCGMTSLGLVCECVAMLVGTPWVALWLIVRFPRHTLYPTTPLLTTKTVLGHNQRLHLLLLPRPRPRLLQMGLRHALIPNSIRLPNTTIRHKKQVRLEFRRLDCVDCRGDGYLGADVLFHAVEDDQGEEEGGGSRGGESREGKGGQWWIGKVQSAPG